MFFFRRRSIGLAGLAGLGAMFIALACAQGTQGLEEGNAPNPTAVESPVDFSSSDERPSTPAPASPDVATLTLTATTGPKPAATPDGGQAVTEPESLPAEIDLTLRTPEEPPPRVDKSIAIVDVGDVLFDTFGRGFLRLSEADDEAVESLRDRIKPIYEPKYEGIEGGKWSGEGDLVIGYVSEKSGDAYAYPVKMLNLHEIVNDVIDGEPILISYCPLCVSGVVYSRELDGRVLLFGNTSALYESDLVMYDHETGSYWFQVLGEAIVGPLSGDRLRLLPSVTITWGDWKNLHPETRILSRDLGLLPSTVRGSPYDRDPFEGYQDYVNDGRFAFPVSPEKLDDRLRPGDIVFAVQIGDIHRAYALSDKPDQVINDEVDGEPILVVARDKGPTAAAYERTLAGRLLTFSFVEGVLQDEETSSRWDDGGRAISGSLAGSQLVRVPSRTSFWFSLVGSLPDVELYAP